MLVLGVRAAQRRRWAGHREDKMEFSLFLSCYCPESKASTAQVYAEMLEMAQAAERLGYCGLTVPEHHFINILMNPNPFMLAVKVASVTERIRITTAVAVLPLNDMRRMAGEAALADVLTGGRLEIGVGRGAFPYEFERYGVDFTKSRDEGVHLRPRLSHRVFWPDLGNRVEKSESP